MERNGINKGKYSKTHFFKIDFNKKKENRK